MGRYIFCCCYCMCRRGSHAFIDPRYIHGRTTKFGAARHAVPATCAQPKIVLNVCYTCDYPYNPRPPCTGKKVHRRW